MKTIPSLISIALLFSGCTYKVSKYGQFDPRQKTITVARGSGVFVQPVKEALMQNGWSLYTNAGTFRTIGTTGKHVDLESAFCVPARYSLSILDGHYSSPQTKAFCVIATFGIMLPYIPFSPTYSDLNISVVDNQTGQEVLTITGSGKESGLKRAIQENML